MAITAASVLLLFGAILFPSPPAEREGGGATPASSVSFEEKRTMDNFLGIRVGSTLEAARAILQSLGEGGGKDIRNNGRREAWALKDGDFQSVAFQAGGNKRIKWITGYLRKGREFSMDALGEAKSASRFSSEEAIWNVPTSDGGFRLIAKGAAGKATVVTLISTATKDIG
jgi:hypothetical protein